MSKISKGTRMKAILKKVKAVAPKGDGYLTRSLRKYLVTTTKK